MCDTMCDTIHRYSEYGWIVWMHRVAYRVAIFEYRYSNIAKEPLIIGLIYGKWPVCEWIYAYPHIHMYFLYVYIFVYVKLRVYIYVSIFEYRNTICDDIFVAISMNRVDTHINTQLCVSCCDIDSSCRWIMWINRVDTHINTQLCVSCCNIDQSCLWIVWMNHVDTHINNQLHISCGNIDESCEWIVSHIVLRTSDMDDICVAIPMNRVDTHMSNKLCDAHMHPYRNKTSCACASHILLWYSNMEDETRINRVSYDWVVAHMNASCLTWMSVESFVDSFLNESISLQKSPTKKNILCKKHADSYTNWDELKCIEMNWEALRSLLQKSPTKENTLCKGDL